MRRLDLECSPKVRAFQDLVSSLVLGGVVDTEEPPIASP